MRFLLAFMIFLLSGKSFAQIKEDEVVDFFPTFGYQTSRGEWIIHIHGWIYEPEEDSLSRGVALNLLRRSLGLKEEETQTDLFMERARLFLVDNERGKRITFRVGEKTVTLISEPNGHFQGDLRLSDSQIQRLLNPLPVPDEAEGTDEKKPEPATAQALRVNRWLSFQATQPPEADFSAVVSDAGSVQIINPEGLSIISDLDDTIKISEVRNRNALLRNTFLEEFQAVSGMAQLYQKWAQQGAVFHYVSASPWQLYKPLSSFLSSAGFPTGSYHLKTFRWKDSSFLDLFATPEKTKFPIIESLFNNFPHRKFILVGDSGEKDPEIYGTIARKYPHQVANILIRNVTGEEPHAPRFQQAFTGVPESLWQVFLPQ
ncbi:MAG: App1 family protein [Nitrospira sp.]|nr:App1 family protein [Nitrospira sp.]